MAKGSRIAQMVETKREDGYTIAGEMFRKIE